MSNQNNFQDIIDLLERDDSTDAPSQSVTWAKNLFAIRAKESKPGILQRIRAHLNVDLAPGTLVPGERSAKASSIRQMLFEAGDFAVDVRLEQKGRTYDVRGQILGHGFDSGSITFIDKESRELHFAIQQARFEGVAIEPAEYSLIVKNHEIEIIIESVTI